MASFLQRLIGRGKPSGDKFLLPAGRERVFRVVRTASGKDSKSGQLFIRSGVGTSLVSLAEAEQAATGNAAANLQNALRGAERRAVAYAYSVERSIEPLFETLDSSDPDGASANVTVNSYGALVINANRALFVDVDTEAGTDEIAAQCLAELVGHQPELGFRVYRTRAGWRYLCTTHAFDPAANSTQLLLEALQSDPNYRLLCRIQNCFRARLTPKPWRAGYYAIVYSKERGMPRKELERYLKQTNGFASAQFVSTVGSGACLPELGAIRDYHDGWTQADSGKPLA